MRIAAITKFKHGALFLALRQLGWNQSQLAKRCEVHPSIIGTICNLKIRPSEQMAEKIERTLVEAGADFDAREAWPETFKGFTKPITVEQIGELDQRELEAAQTFHMLQELNIESDDLNEFDSSKIPTALETLKPQEQEVLSRRFGIGGIEEMTLEQLGEKYNVTRERIRQIEAKALRKLRHPSREKLLLATPEIA